MGYVKYPVEMLDRFCMTAFSKIGFSEEDCRTITDVLLLSDLYGIESHGMQRLVRYHKGIEKGIIKVDAKPEIVTETPVSAVIDANDAMGQVVGKAAMELAIAKAKTSGIGIVSVRNSNHYGIAGYYAKLACDAGLIGFSGTNSEAIMVPTFGRLAMIGSNPIAISMPADPYPFFFDASTTVVTRGKLEMYNKMEKPLPDGSEEQLGSHKGYGNGMICEIFSSIISMGTTSNYCMKGRSGICHFFAAIDPKIFGDPAEIKEHLSTYLRELRESPKAEGHDRIYTHGEKEIFATEDRKKNGVPVNENTVVEMIEFAKFVGIDPKEYFGDFKMGESKMFSQNY